MPALSDADVGLGPVQGAIAGAVLSDADLWGAPSTAQAPQPSLMKQLGAGMVEGLTSLPDLLMRTFDPGAQIAPQMDFNWAAAHDPAYQAAAKAHGMTPEQLARLDTEHALPHIGHAINSALGAVGMNPEAVPAPTVGDRLVRGAGAGIAGLALPGGEVSTVADLLRSGAVAATAGASSQAATEIAPEPLKPIAAIVGGLLGGHVAGSAIGGAEAAARATEGAVAPSVAGISEPVARRAAGQVLARSATDAKTVAEMLEGGAQEVVPGSKPTTFQQTGDMGLGNLERSVATERPDLFMARRAEQNAARLGTLEGLQTGGDPLDLANGLRTQLADMDTAADQRVQTLASAAQGKVQSLGGAQAPEDYGAQVRSTLQDAEDAARQREGALWKAVDPDGTLGGNVVQTRTAARQIMDDLPRTAKPMGGEESAIFDVASKLPAVAPISDLIALRSRVSTELRNELIANGRSPAYARLSQLRGAIQANLADTISDAVENDERAVARNAIAPDEAAGAKVQGWIHDWRQQREAGNAVGGENPAVAGGGAGTVPGVDGAGGPTTGGPSAPAGDQGLPPTPAIDEAALDRLAAATAATRERARTFGVNPVSAVLNKASASDLYRLPEARAPEKFFHPGPTGYSDVQALIKAAGAAKALPLLVDYAASSLRRAALRDDGTLDPIKFGRWRQAHADALRALPDDVRGHFTQAAQASQAVIDAVRMREAALKDAQAGAVGKLIGATAREDVVRTVANVLGSRTAASDMTKLAEAAKKDPFAWSGLRQAVADVMTRKLVSNTEAATSGQSLLKSDQFQTFVKTNRAALEKVFTPLEMRNIEAIGEDLRRANRSAAAVKLPNGSNTAQDLASIARRQRITRSVLDGIGTALGAAVGHVPGAVVGMLGADFLQTVRAKGVDRIDQLVTEAMLNPEVARELLKRAHGPLTPTKMRPLTASLKASLAASSLKNLANQPPQAH